MNLTVKFDTKAQSIDWAFFMTFCCFNHQLEPIDVSESWFRQRAFQFGDGHFTTAKIERGQIVWWSLHLQRLKNANQRLKITDIEWQQLSYVCQTMSKPIQSGYIKIQISRGESVRGYSVNSEMAPSIFVTANEIDLPILSTLNDPIEIAQVQTKLGLNPQLAGLKHSNRIEQSLIQLELNNYPQHEGIVGDINGNLIESSKGNVFWCENDQWYTPELTSSGVDGVFRQWLLKQKTEINIVTKSIKEVIACCEAMFITNAIAGAVPIKAIYSYGSDSKDANSNPKSHVEEKSFNEGSDEYPVINHKLLKVEPVKMFLSQVNFSELNGTK